MYRYDDHDRAILADRRRQFRGQVARRLAGKLSEDEFKPLRLMNGLYLQLHAYMLRIAVPYGLLSSDQLRKLAHIARTYDKGYGHFTTRQNLQFNWPALDKVPDILDELAEVEMHSVQTSGNCIRNITADPFAGVAADEIEDPRPYAEILRQYSTFHPEFSYLPRKFKFAITGAAQDRAAVQFHDIGLRLIRGANDEIGFEVLAGGGMGRTPMIGKLIRPWLEKRHLLSYVEAIMRVYNQFGRRDNMFKARIKILLHELGVAEFRRRVEEEWEHIRDSGLLLDEAEIARMKGFFTAPDYAKTAGAPADLAQKKQADKAFAKWASRNVTAHKVPGYAIVTLSLKAPGVPPGDVTADQMERIAELADRYSFGELRTTFKQNLVLTDVREADLYDLWRALRKYDLATPNIETLNDIICCPGLDFCALANARSIPVSLALTERFENYDYLYDLGELRLNISGCINACGHHHTAHIGILGVDKKGEEFYQITLGGAPGNDASIGAIIGPAFAASEVVGAVDDILQVYLEAREEGERFIDTYRRLGADPFKERVYANH
jgi:sulfite reductase (NADPH) hemoprotein beta-component